MRKTVKKLPNFVGSDEYVSQEKNYHESQGNIMEDVQSANQERNNRVAQLLNQITESNDGNKLADFQPLAHPVIQKRTDEVEGRSADDMMAPQNNPLQIPPPQVHRRTPGESDFSAVSQDLGNNPYSNYRMIYEQPPTNTSPLNYYAKMGLGNGAHGLDSKLLEKINYMIHMLEQQHNEKTSNVTEEFVLYTFLGVFIIFIVDAFSRAGKYVR